VPRQALLRNFERLREVAAYFEPRSICFLGDLFHSHINREWALFEEWAHGCPARLDLVCGNHDIISPLRYEALGIGLWDRWENGPFLLTHEPEETGALFNISGHIHPAVRLAGPGRQKLRLPCFFLRRHQLILPAFGAFTGTHTLVPEAGDRIFALAGDSVIALDEPAPGALP
jgi:DNA ligase-associated metallophosphoesterase